LIQKFGYMDTVNFGKSNNILIVSLNGGVGHQMAAQCIEGEASKKGIKFDRRDALAHLGGSKKIGDYCAKLWNEAQKKGAIEQQKRLFKGRWFAELTFAIPIFFRTIYLLLKFDYDLLINTQFLGTRAMIHAVRIANLINLIFNLERPEIRMIMVMTDLPTKRAAHFFGTLKGLKSGDRRVFQMLTVKPLLSKGESEHEFWMNHCGLSLKKGEVKYCVPPIRPAFKAISENPEWKRPQRLRIKINSDEELKLIAQTLRLGPNAIRLVSKNKKKYFTYPVGRDSISQKDVISMVQLGSQAAIESTLAYVKAAISNANESNPLKEYHIFVFCGSHIDGQKTLLKKVHEFVHKKIFPPNIHIIPMGFQDDEESAPIIASCDIPVIRTGGITAMEVNEVARSKIFMHSEAKKRRSRLNLTQADLFKGAVLWERGNAEYLKEKKGAKMINPTQFSQILFKESGSN
jgi:hypothetical protein